RLSGVSARLRMPTSERKLSAVRRSAAKPSCKRDDASSMPPALSTSEPIHFRTREGDISNGSFNTAGGVNRILPFSKTSILSGGQYLYNVTGRRRAISRLLRPAAERDSRQILLLSSRIIYYPTTRLGAFDG